MIYRTLSQYLISFVGRRKVRVQIIFQHESDIGNTIDILNSLKREINEDLSGIEFIVATQGSIVLIVEIFMEMMETSEILQSTLSLFIGKIWKIIQTSSIESIDMVILPVEGLSLVLVFPEYQNYDIKILCLSSMFNTVYFYRLFQAVT